MAPHLLINKPAPEFSIPDANGHMFKFPPEEQGVRVKKPIALFFYPEAGKHPFTCSGPNYCVHPFAAVQERSVALVRLVNFVMH